MISTRNDTKCAGAWPRLLLLLRLSNQADRLSLHACTPSGSLRLLLVVHSSRLRLHVPVSCNTLPLPPPPAFVR
jgi:hypothetical protein